MKKQIEAGEKPDLNIYFAGKNAIADFVSDMDLVITLCDVPNGRPSFGMSKGGGEIPWYVFEVPVVVVGMLDSRQCLQISRRHGPISTLRFQRYNTGCVS